MKHPDGSIITQYFETTDESMTGRDIYDQGLRIVAGQVEKVYYVDDAANVSKKHIEYDVSVKNEKGGQTVLRNIRKIDFFGGTNDHEETVLEPNEYAFKGKLEKANLMINKNGTTVLVASIDGSKEKPVIIASLQHPKLTGGKKSDGIHKIGEFRGFQWEINKDGDFILTFNGSKKPNGQQANIALNKTTIKIGKDGQVKTSTGHVITFENALGKEKVQIFTAGKQLFSINDLAGQESITLVHKQGSFLNIDKDGSVKLAGADGAYMFLNAVNNEVSLVQKSGALLSLGTEQTLASGDGNRAISILSDKIQAFSDKDIVLQAAQKLILNGGGVILQDPIAKIKIQNGQIAIGTPVAELLDLMSQTLTQMIDVTTLLSTTLSTAPGLPVSTAPAFIPITAQLAAIQLLLTTIKGTI